MDLAAIGTFFIALAGLVAAVSTALRMQKQAQRSVRRDELVTLRAVIDELQDENVRLRAEMVEMRAEIKVLQRQNVQLVRENIELHALVGQLQSDNADRPA